MFLSDSHKSINNMSNLCYTFSSVFDIIMACPTCSKRVLSHAYSMQCHYCENTYHMKCISLEIDYISQLKDNRENWLCGCCITDIFPYNRLDDDEFSQAILMKLENELMISNLIFNPHESNSFDLSYCTEFDPDANFFVNKIYFQDMHAHITQKMNWMIKWAHLCREMSSIFHYVT